MTVRRLPLFATVCCRVGPPSQSFKFEERRRQDLNYWIGTSSVSILLNDGLLVRRTQEGHCRLQLSGITDFFNLSRRPSSEYYCSVQVQEVQKAKCGQHRRREEDSCKSQVKGSRVRSDCFTCLSQEQYQPSPSILNGHFNQSLCSAVRWDPSTPTHVNCYRQEGARGRRSRKTRSIGYCSHSIRIGDSHSPT